MGKVTVKHYLNTRVQIVVHEDEDKHLHEHFKNRYPVYLQITFNRKTTQIKSFTCVYMTKEEFDFYQNGELDKISKDTFLLNDRKETFIHEPARIKKTIEYLMTRYKIEKFEDNLKNWVKSFLQPIREGLTEMCWDYIIIRPLTDKEAKKKESFYKCFNRNLTLYESLKCIEKISGYNIEKCIPEEDLVVWKDISILIKVYERNNNSASLIDFVDSDYISYINKISSIKDKSRFIHDIEQMIEIQS